MDRMSIIKTKDLIRYQNNTTRDSSVSVIPLYVLPAKYRKIKAINIVHHKNEEISPKVSHRAIA